jgi:hypothetical protein
MKKLVYRVAENGGVVFAEPDRANLIAKIHAAIRSSTTWGEFRFAMPREEYEDLVQTGFDSNGEPRPKSTDPFSGELVPGWSDGDYPPWLQTEMQRILPAPVLEQFGKMESTFLNGNFWLIPEQNLEGICAALVALGWKLERAQDLEFY